MISSCRAKIHEVQILFPSDSCAHFRRKGETCGARKSTLQNEFASYRYNRYLGQAVITGGDQFGPSRSRFQNRETRNHGNIEENSKKIVKHSHNGHKTTRKHCNPGIYTVPRGHVSIAVPAFWTLRQTNDDLEIEAPSETTSVIVTAFKQDKTTGPLDARDFLKRFMQTAPSDGRGKVEKGTRQKASCEISRSRRRPLAGHVSQQWKDAAAGNLQHQRATDFERSPNRSRGARIAQVEIRS